MPLPAGLSEEFLSTTSFNYLQKRRSLQSQPHPLLETLLKAKQKNEGGDLLIVPFDVRRVNRIGGTRWITGYESVLMDFQRIHEAGNVGQAFTVYPIPWSMVDEQKNSSAQRQISLIEEYTKDVHDDAEENAETHFLQGGITAMADWQTFNGDDVADGFLESIAPGAQNNVVQDFNKASFAALPGANNQFGDINGTFSTAGLSTLREHQVRLRSLTKGGRLAGIASIMGATNYGRAVQASERYTAGGADAVSMIEEISIGGIMYKISRFMPNAGPVTGVATQEWSFLTIDLEAAFIKAFAGMSFDQEPFQRIPGTGTSIALVHVAGQLVIIFFGSCGIIRGGDTW